MGLQSKVPACSGFLVPLYSSIQLHLLFMYLNSPSVFSRTLGTPNNDVWPDVESLPDYKNTFPKWKSGNLSSMVKNLDKNGLDLMAVRIRGSLPQTSQSDKLSFYVDSTDLQAKHTGCLCTVWHLHC